MSPMPDSQAVKANRRATVLLVGNDDQSRMIRRVARGIARVIEVSDYRDVLVMASDLVIIDPALFSEGDWETLCDTYGSYVDVWFKLLLLSPSPYKAEMPKRNLISVPPEVTPEFLRQQMVIAGTPPKSRLVWQKKEPQMRRLMYMLYRLEHSVLRLKDVAEHFDVSQRTVQRDFQVLMSGDYIILDGEEPGTYTFPKGYKAHEAYCP